MSRVLSSLLILFSSCTLTDATSLVKLFINVTYFFYTKMMLCTQRIKVLCSTYMLLTIQYDVLKYRSYRLSKYYTKVETFEAIAVLCEF